MSLMHKMSILGIRSFGPKDDDKQVIQFQHPLTLIVGPNGSGKTTIIECLKYATTGDHPQNTKGGAFVHDPKLVFETEVKAKVQLLCTNVHGERLTVERGMQAIQKQKTVQFKTQDGVITKTKRNGEEVQITSKCAEINNEMVASLGVSKAVLENVIFCHQEDSSWPLGEGKSVKQKFDDIFEATRYIKALEELRKVQKDKKSEILRLKAEMPHLEVYCNTAKKKRQELQALQTKLETVETTRREFAEKFDPLREKMQTLRKEQDHVRKLSSELQTVESRREQMISDKEKLKSRIRNLFEGSDAELGRLLEEEDAGMSTIREEERKLNDEIKSLDDEIHELTQKSKDYSIKQGQLQSEIDLCEKKRSDLTAMIDTYSRKLKIPSPFEPTDDEEHRITISQVEQFLASFNEHCRKEAADLNSVKAKYDAELKGIEEEHQQIKQDETELRVGSKHLTEMLIQKKGKYAKNVRELSRLDCASENDELETLQTDLELAQEKLKAHQESGNVDELRQEMKGLQRQIKLDQKTLEGIEKDVAVLHKTSEARMRVEMVDSEMAGKEATIAESTTACLEGLKKAKSQLPPSQTGKSTLPSLSAVESLLAESEEESRSIRNKLDDRRMELGRLREKRDSLASQTKHNQTRVSELDESLFEVCGSQDLEAEISTMEFQIEELRESKGVLHGTQHLFRDYIKKLNASKKQNECDVPCPLCHRTFDDVSEVLELTQDLEKKLEMAPKRLEKRLQELKQKEERHKTLLEQKPVKSQLDVLTQQTLPDLVAESERIEKRIGEMEREVEECESQLEEARASEDAIKSVQPKIRQVHTLEKEVRDLKRKKKVMEDGMPRVASSKTIDQLDEDKKQLSASLRADSQAVEEKRRKVEEFTEKEYQLRENLNTAQEKKLNLSGQLQKRGQIQEEQEVLSKEISKIKKDLAELEEKQAPLSKRAEDARRRGETMREEREIRVTGGKGELERLERARDEIIDVAKQVEACDREDFHLIAEKLRKKLTSCETRMRGKSDRQREVRARIGELQKRSASFADRQRDLDDNKALRDREREIGEVDAQVARIAAELAGQSFDDMERELNALSRERSAMEKELTRCNVRQETFRENISTLKKELNEENYKNADAVYKDCLVRSVVVGMAADDLEKYYKALDRAIMRFHKTKMDEINKIIRDLWQQTYRGKDIDYIEICSSDDTGSLSATRRTFNYRVVMHAGNVSMDMRGRCSAGQKVLASIVIRLALAEAFCINCGVMALDEPTTNLDRENIEGLAEALVNIIESRQRQRNFQLIVITHDEDFVELLGRSSYVDHFFRVSKDLCAKSHILRCPIRTLGA